MNELQAAALNNLAEELEDFAVYLDGLDRDGKAGPDDPKHMAGMFRLQAEDHRYHARKLVADNEEMTDDERHRLQRSIEMEHLQLESARRAIDELGDATKKAKRQSRRSTWLFVGAVVLIALTAFSMGLQIMYWLLKGAAG